jgi:hypothetical protein
MSGLFCVSMIMFVVCLFVFTFSGSTATACMLFTADLGADWALRASLRSKERERSTGVSTIVGGCRQCRTCGATLGCLPPR